MNIIFPRLTGTYMTDELFINLGQFSGTSTALMRAYAFGLAESAVEQEVGSFISSTTVTGSYPFVSPNSVLDLGVGRLTSVNSVVLYEKYNNGSDRLISGTARVLDYDSALIAIDASPYDDSTCNNCGGIAYQGVYKAEISFTSGYQTGQVVNNPSFMMPLAMASTLFLNQLMDSGMGQDDEAFITTIQVGRSIISRTNKFARDGSLGSGVKANFIRSMLRPITITKAGKLGR